MIGPLRHYADWAAWLGPRRLWIDGWFGGPHTETLSVGLGSVEGVQRCPAAMFTHPPGSVPAGFRRRTLLVDVDAAWERESEIRGVTVDLASGPLAWLGSARLPIGGDLGGAAVRLQGLPAATLLDLLGFVAHELVGGPAASSALARRNVRLLLSLIADVELPSGARNTQSGWAVAFDDVIGSGCLGLASGWAWTHPTSAVEPIVVQPSGAVAPLRAVAATYRRSDLDRQAARWRGTPAGFLLAFSFEGEEAAAGAPLITVYDGGQATWVRGQRLEEGSFARCRSLIAAVLDEPNADQDAGAAALVRELGTVMGRPAVPLAALECGDPLGDAAGERSLLVAIPVDDPMRAEIQLAELAREGGLRGAELVWLVDNSAWTAAIGRRCLRLAELYGVRLIVRVVAEGCSWGALMNAARLAAGATAEIAVFCGRWALPTDARWRRDLETPLADAATAVVGARTVFEGGGVRDSGVALGAEVAALAEWSRRPSARAAPASGEVAAIPGTCVGVRLDRFDALGGFDGAYHCAGAEAFDLCLRARAAGSRVVLSSDAFYDLSPTDAWRSPLKRLARIVDGQRLARRWSESGPRTPGAAAESPGVGT